MPLEIHPTAFFLPHTFRGQMRSIIPFLTCVALLTLHHPLSAQTPTLQVPSPEAIEQMMEAAKRMMNPAALVLAHRNELQLTGEQAAILERFKDQMGSVVEQQMARQSEGGTRSIVARAMQDPTLTLDEETIRAEACKQARQQADLSIQMIRTQRGVTQILTPAQQRKLAELQAAEMMQMMQGMFEPSKRP